MIQTISTHYNDAEFENLLEGFISKSVRSEITKLLSNQKPQKTIYTRQETAEMLDISLPTLNEYTKHGFIIAYRLGHKVRYKIEDINNALIKITTKNS